MKPYFENLNCPEIIELERLVLNCESFENLKQHLELEKINKHFIDLTLTKIN